MLCLTVAVGFPIVPWLVDIVMNMKNSKLVAEGGEDVEI